jgi:hypothetical protein
MLRVLPAGSVTLSPLATDSTLADAPVQAGRKRQHYHEGHGRRADPHGETIGHATREDT